MPDWRTITGAKTAAELLTEGRDLLRSWSSRLFLDPAWGVFYDFAKVYAWLQKTAYDLLATLAPEAFASYAAADWLDYHAMDYGLTRTPARKAQWYITFTRAAAAAPLAVTGTWVSTTTGDDGSVFRFRRAEDATAATGELTIDVLFEAEFEGTDYNVGQGAITVMESAFAGWASITNLDRVGPPVFEALEVAGLDLETDESLRARMLGRWSERGSVANEAAYIAWVLDVDPNAIVQVVANDGVLAPGNVKIYVSGTDGPPAASLLAEIQSYINNQAPITDDVDVVTYTEDSTVVTATLYVVPGTAQATMDAMEAIVETTITDMFGYVDVAGVRRFAIGEDIRLDRIRGAVFTALDAAYPNVYTRLVFAAPAVDDAVASGHRGALAAGSPTITVTAETAL